MAAAIRKNYFLEDFEPTNHRKSDRMFVLEAMENADKTKLDTRLVNGNNHLHAIKNPTMSMWSLKMEHGILPEALKSNFTSFAAAQRHVEQYYLKRGVKVTEIID